MKKLLLVCLALVSSNVYAGLITHTDYTAGNVITAAGQNTNENAIFNEFNGSINSANIAALGVATSNLAAGAVTQAKLANGSLSAPSTAVKTSSYTLLTSDDLIISSVPTNASTFTLTLPTAVGATGKVYLIVIGNRNLGGLTTVLSNGSELIGSATSVKLQTPNESLKIVSDGANWQILSHYAGLGWTAYTPTFTNFGTVSAVSVFYRRVGDELQVHGSFTSGTVQAGAGKISFPGTGLLIDSSKISGGSLDIAGIIWQHNSSATAFLPSNQSFLFADGSNQDGVFLSYQSETNKFKANLVNAQIASSQPCSFEFHVPISGWSN